MTDVLSGRIALITGGGTGIGRAIAEAFVAAGATTYIAGRRERILRDTAEAIGARPLAVDVTRLPEIDALYERIRDESGRLDVLVANAGTTETRALTDATEDHFDTLVDLNFKGVFFTVQKALPLLSDGAAILLTGSAAAHAVLNGGGVYAASKAAVRTLAKVWAWELGPRGIRVNVLIPGATADTPLLDAALSTDAGRARMAGYMDRTPLRRLGRAQEVAAAALFLCSPAAAYTTGVEFPVDGGLTQV